MILKDFGYVFICKRTTCLTSRTRAVRHISACDNAQACSGSVSRLPEMSSSAYFCWAGWARRPPDPGKKQTTHSSEALLIVIRPFAVEWRCSFWNWAIEGGAGAPLPHSSVWEANENTHPTTLENACWAIFASHRKVCFEKCPFFCVCVDLCSNPLSKSEKENNNQKPLKKPLQVPFCRE